MATSRRSIVDIQLQLAETEAFAERLREELAAIQPDKLEIPNVLGQDGLAFAISHGGHLDVRNRRRASLHILRPARAAELRDWLNYHFPKTEENA